MARRARSRTRPGGRHRLPAAGSGSASRIRDTATARTRGAAHVTVRPRIVRRASSVTAHRANRVIVRPASSAARRPAVRRGQAVAPARPAAVAAATVLPVIPAAAAVAATHGADDLTESIGFFPWARPSFNGGRAVFFSDPKWGGRLAGGRPRPRARPPVALRSVRVKKAGAQRVRPASARHTKIRLRGFSPMRRAVYGHQFAP